MPDKIHPVIIYPFTDPYTEDEDKDRGVQFVRRDLEYLYEELAALIKRTPNQNYEDSITVVNRQTINRSKQEESKLEEYINDYVGKNLITSWCVDSCQMWLTGLGAAFDKEKDRKEDGDVFWLIPGDYKYSQYSNDKDNKGKNIFDEMVKLPKTVLAKEIDLCLGEIKTDTNSSKSLIDTYGTYGLLANWFPYDAQQIWKLTSKPRTEFFAVSSNFLSYLLDRRWYAYEQTLVMLLHCYVGGIKVRNVDRVLLGKISDATQGRDSLSGAMQQVERTERVLKLFWREENQDKLQWIDTFRRLDSQSEQIKGAALVILENLLK